MTWVSPLLAVLLPALVGANISEPPQQIGRKIDSFKLRDQLGTWRSLEDYKSSKLLVVAFLGVECPLAKLYAVRLGEMEREYRDKGVTFLAIDGNRQDSVTELQHYATKHKIEFPILKDTDNGVTDIFAAVRTPEIFVLDQDRKVRYHGRVDDQYAVGIARRQATQHDLKNAINDLLASRQVAKATTETPGCLIGRLRTPKPGATVTYSKDIAPIFRQRCESCHRDGEIGPISLQNYDDVVGWADTIAEVVRDQRMPPWHADEKYGAFRNDCRLSAAEKQTIYDWVEAGAPEGSPSDLPPPAQFTEGWQIPKPDLVVSMEQPVHVRATGVMGYEHIVVDPHITEDKWVIAAEARPGARSVVHHIIVFVKPPGDHEDQNQTELDRAGSRFLVATAPGARPMLLEPGTAKLIPAGSKLVFQMHYTPNGTAQDDLSSVGLVFADPKTIKKRVKTAFSGTFVISIPPNDPEFPIVAQRSMQYDTLLLNMMPHMHVRGSAFRYTALYPDGSKEILLDVPHYDFNWQNTYELKEPKLLPAGTILEARAVYNNSPENPTNPDPNGNVHFGEQTWDEMMLGFYEACPADQDLQKGGLGEVSRAEAFLDSLGGDGDPVSPHLKELARQALINGTDFRKFVLATRLLVPQVDRIDVSTLDGNNLEVVFAVNGSNVNSRYYMPGSKQAAQGFALAQYAAGNEPIVNDDLAKTKGFDMKLMRREFKSSFHVPLTINGKKGVVSFWSKDKVAFPGLAVDVLRIISNELAKKKMTDKPATADSQAKS
ncbi:redoxin domain-containing protein [bacterium]|nr:redoxin domain-containing protein [bacterium]